MRPCSPFPLYSGMSMTDFPQTFTMTIDGQPVSSSAWFQVINPATETIVAHAPDASRAELDAAVAGARRALPAWRVGGIRNRREVLSAMADAIDGDLDTLSMLLTLEQGKPLKAARDEITRSAIWLRDVSAFELPEHINEDTPERLSITQRVPIGVVGAIVPWNYPVLLAAWKIAPALLCGNSVIVKPSPFTPLTMLRIGMLTRALLPAGVFSVVSGGDDLGPWMTEHPGIDKIAFTGSTETGRRVMQSASATLKRLTLELGGNDAAIVMPDCDPDVIVPALFAAAFGNSGQICIATKRLYVHDSLFDRIASALADLARDARIGNGLDDDVDFGPIQNRLQYERVTALISDSKAHGHHFLAGGTAWDGKGFFVPLTIIADPPETSRVVAEEAFGPVLPILRYHDIDDVIARVNASSFGLGASIWSRDVVTARRLADRIEAGTIWINETRYITAGTALAGHKQSGLGTEHGTEGLYEYTLPQTVSIKK